VDFNGPAAQRLVRATCGDARAKMMGAPSGYEVVDLDPYGSPSIFLDTAMQARARREGALD